MTPQRPPAIQLMRNLGLEPYPWQLEVLETTHKRLLLNCSRQAGKSTVVALLALTEAIFVGGTKILLVSRSHRQSNELLKIITDFYTRLGEPIKLRLNSEELALTNASRILSLPCREETIRGYSNISLLVIDEAARVPDDLYRATRPMLAVGGGRLFCLSTPFGKRGFFYQCFATGGDDWKRIQVPVTQIPRITPEFMAEERRQQSESWIRQEYFCSFEALEGLVFPDFAQCTAILLTEDLQPLDRACQATIPHLLPSPRLRGEGPGVRGEPVSDSHPKGSAAPILPSPRARGEGSGVRGKLVGGIDFGFRNPFAAIWGILDADGVLWLTGEHYSREKPLSYHAENMPRGVMWYADPSGALEINEFLRAGFKVRRGRNDRRLGIAAVRARLENGTLRMLSGRCPNLLAEAGLYRYGSAAEGYDPETPIDEHNHALAALRYLIATLDAGHLARPRKPATPNPPPADTPGTPPPPPPPPRDKWNRYDNDDLWTPLY